MEPPLIPYVLYKEFKEFDEKADRKVQISFIKERLKKLPSLNYDVLEFMCGFLLEVTNYKEENKMDYYNCAVCFAPNFFRPRVLTQADI